MRGCFSKTSWSRNFGVSLYGELSIPGSAAGYPGAFPGPQHEQRAGPALSAFFSAQAAGITGLGCGREGGRCREGAEAAQPDGAESGQSHS